MKKTLCTLLVLFTCIVHSQTYEEIQKSIRIVEDLYYHEVYLGVKTYQKLNISLDTLSNKISYNKTRYIREDLNTKWTDTFYLEDVDSVSVRVYHLVNIEPGLKNKYNLVISVKTGENLIKNESLELNKDEFPLP
ncbi:MAG: hypothetical protein WA749_11280, partial [Gelidibacter sp.]